MRGALSPVRLMKLWAASLTIACSGGDAQGPTARTPDDEVGEATLEADGSVFVPALGGTNPFTLSARIIPCAADLVRYGAAALKSKERSAELAKRVSLPFPFWLEQCATKYDFMLPPGPGQRPGQRVAPEQALRNYLGVELCLVEVYHSRARWMPRLLELVDVCQDTLGEAWSMPTTPDLNGVTPAQWAHLRSIFGRRGLPQFGETTMFARDTGLAWMPGGPFSRVYPQAMHRHLSPYDPTHDTDIAYQHVELRCIHRGTERAFQAPPAVSAEAERCANAMKRHTAKVDQPAYSGHEEVADDEVRAFGVWVELMIAPDLFRVEEASRRIRALQTLPSHRWAPWADWANRNALIVASRSLLDDGEWARWTNQNTPALRAALEEFAHGQQPPRTADNERAQEGFPALSPRHEYPLNGPVPTRAPQSR